MIVLTMVISLKTQLCGCTYHAGVPSRAPFPSSSNVSSSLSLSKHKQKIHMSLAFFRSASSSDSMASDTGLPSGSAPPLFPDSPSILDFIWDSSSSTVPPSSSLNLSSRSLPAVSMPVASACASMPMTFSSIFSNALSALEVETPEMRFWTSWLDLADAARAFKVSFLLLASAILASRNRVLAMSFSVASFCCSRLAAMESAFSW
mmetsp:Transcript_10243/g.47016  ORF Transcript_10243/g.47016 Transcript_10243/m.47016 type:complete len:205 (+) Transcript_10243:1564-2178(+)